MGILERIADKTGIGNKRAVLADAEVGGTEIVLNVARAYERSWDDDVSTHAIEDGTDITDNINLNPYTISLDITLTDSKSGFEFIQDRKTVKEKMDQILEWRSNKTILVFFFDKTIFNKNKKNSGALDSVVIKSLRESRTKDLGNGLGITLTLQEILLPSAALESTGVANKGKSGKGTDTISDAQNAALTG